MASWIHERVLQVVRLHLPPEHLLLVVLLLLHTTLEGLQVCLSLCWSHEAPDELTFFASGILECT